MSASYITPAVTMLNEQGQPDLEANCALYEHLIRGGVDGILVLGSIGEFFALPLAQRRRLAFRAIEAVAHRTKVIIGTASMVFEEVASFSNACIDHGADAVIIISPYYFPLDDEGVYAYYSALAQAIHGRIYLYNFPGRTGYSLSAQVVRRLALTYPNIVGIKDTIPGMDHTRELIEAIKPLRPDFEIYSGFDENLTANVVAGGDGCIAGLSNLYPEICARAARMLRERNADGIVTGQRLIQQLFALYAIGSNFIPVIKEGVCMRGVQGSGRCTFPLPAMTQAQRQALCELMQRVERAAQESSFLCAN